MKRRKILEYSCPQDISKLRTQMGFMVEFNGENYLVGKVQLKRAHAGKPLFLETDKTQELIDNDLSFVETLPEDSGWELFGRNNKIQGMVEKNKEMGRKTRHALGLSILMNDKKGLKNLVYLHNLVLDEEGE